METFPETNSGANRMSTERVPCPETIVAPAGADQMYPVPPEVDAPTEYVFVPQTCVVGPAITAGATGVDRIVIDLAALRVHGVPDFTVTVPLANVEGSVTFMELVPWPLFMVAPAGTVHTYVVALETIGQE